MDYKLRSIIAVFVILAVIASLGFLMNENTITGGSVTHTIACHKDKDCNDRLAGTEDICKNPGSEFSLCVNRRINN